MEVLLGVFNKEKALLGTIKHCERSLTALVKVRADETWLHSVIRGRDGVDPGPVWRHGHCERSGHAAVIT